MLMIKLVQSSKKNTIPDTDYVLDKEDKFNYLLTVLTPKFEGVWSILFIEPKLAFMHQLIDNNVIPDYVICYCLISKAKIDDMLSYYPSLLPAEKSVKEQLFDIVKSLNHLVDDRALQLVRQLANNNVSQMVDILRHLDNECDGISITARQVQTTYSVSKRVYASDIIIAFVKRYKYRWSQYYKFVNELGEEYAYYTLRKYVKSLLSDKSKYLRNEDINNYSVSKIDAPLICYMYTVFANSNNWRNLEAVMQCIDNRSNASFERSRYVNLQ